MKHLISALACLLFLILIGVSYSTPVLAQDEADYIDTNDEYVDVVEPGPDGAPQAESSPFVSRASWNHDDQINTGILNYGLSNSVYYQFSGEDIFEDGNPVEGSLGFNWNWSHFNKLDYRIPRAWSYGAELLYFNSTSESIYSGSGDVSGSSIDMNLYMFSVALKAFFMDPVEDYLQPYWGVGWGAFFGDFKSVQNVTNKESTTNFNGLLNYQVLGIQIMLMERVGLMAEIKNMRASADTSNDPFNQGDGDTVELMFDGVIIGLTGFVRL